MNIVKIESSVVKFSKIEVGDCFEYNGNIYLKTNIFCNEGSYTTYNAINLNNNAFEYFYCDTDVIKVNAILSIEYNMEE